MFPHRASWKFHEVIPIPSFLFATAPVLDAIVEDRITSVEVALLVSAFGGVFFQTTLVRAFVIARFSDKYLFLLDFFLCFLLILFSIEFINAFNDRLIFLDLIVRRHVSFISIKLVLILFCIFDCGVFPNSACRYLLEFIPVIDDLVAASPSFFEIMENGLPRVVVASLRPILILQEFLFATVSFAL